VSAPAVLRSFDIGNTPLVALPDLVPGGQVWLKGEYENPFGSVKDRTAAYLLAWARRLAGPRVRVVESTSGNLGIALVRMSRLLGLSCTLVMDASVPPDRITEVRGTGADIELVRTSRPGLTFRDTRIEVAAEIGRRPGCIWLNQYANRAGMRAHQEGTGPEILRDSRGLVDAVVASVGTGGTICGIGAAVRESCRPPVVVGVEPAGSTISGGRDGDYLPAGSGMRGTPGIVTEFGRLIDRFAHVPDAVAACWALTVRRRYGLQVGPTTGAAVAVAALLAGQGLRVVAVAPDRGAAFLPAMRRLAAEPPSAPDGELIELRSFGGVPAASGANARSAAQ
jgi:cysteine synthase A